MISGWSIPPVGILIMKDKYVYVKENIAGFGATQEERARDWEINKLSCCEELPSEWQAVTEQYNPWFPLTDMLHISTVGCLWYKQGMLINTGNNRKVAVNKSGRCVYYYLMQLFGNTLKYDVIRLVLHKQFETLFREILGTSIKLSEYNQIFMEDSKELRDYVRYEFEDCDIFLDEAVVGLRQQGSKYCYMLNRQDDLQADLCYLAYRAGIVWQEV